MRQANFEYLDTLEASYLNNVALLEARARAERAIYFKGLIVTAFAKVKSLFSNLSSKTAAPSSAHLNGCAQ